jgi:predicted DNA-binding protein
MSETKKVQKAKTSIKVEPEIWKEAKKVAIDKGKTVSEVMEEAIKAYIKEFRKK